MGGDQSLVSKDATCYFKAAYSTSDGTNTGLDCYTNICLDSSHEGEISVVPQYLWRIFFKNVNEDGDTVAIETLLELVAAGVELSKKVHPELAEDFGEQMAANINEFDKNQDGVMSSKEFENGYKLPG